MLFNLLMFVYDILEILNRRPPTDVVKPFLNLMISALKLQRVGLYEDSISYIKKACRLYQATNPEI